MCFYRRCTTNQSVMRATKNTSKCFGKFSIDNKEILMGQARHQLTKSGCMRVIVTFSLD